MGNRVSVHDLTYPFSARKLSKYIKGIVLLMFVFIKNVLSSNFYIISFSLYCILQIVLYRKEEILASECEMCVLHCLLSKIPDNLPYEKLISDAGDLFLQYPPTQLANEALLAYKKKK